MRPLNNRELELIDRRNKRTKNPYYPTDSTLVEYQKKSNRTTVCVLHDQDFLSNDIELRIGVSVCSPNDRVHEEAGREIAFMKALRSEPIYV